MAQIRFTVKISNFIDFGTVFPYYGNTIETNEKSEIANNQFPLWFFENVPFSINDVSPATETPIFDDNYCINRMQARRTQVSKLCAYDYNNFAVQTEKSITRSRKALQVDWMHNRFSDSLAHRVHHSNNSS